MANLALVSLLLCAACTGLKAQSWSPDGHLIVLGGSDIVQVDGGTLIPDTKPSGPLPGTVLGSGVSGAGAGLYPAWSPDGSKLAFVAPGSKLTILDTMTHKAISPDASAISPIAWSPDSRFLAYVRTTDAGALEMRTIHENGDMALAVPLPFAKLALGTTNTIAWVPTTDNVIIAGGDDTRTDLYLIDQGQVVPLTTTGDVLGFAVSPQGERVRFIMKSRNTHYILLSVYDLQIGKRKLSKVPFPDRVPLLNPNPRNSVDAVVAASLSPDLNEIALVARGGPAGGQNGSAVYIMDALGKRASLVAKSLPAASAPPPAKPAPPEDNAKPPSPPALPPAVGPGAAPAPPTAIDMPVPPISLPVFSADGKQVAFVRSNGEHRYLSVVQIDSARRMIGLLP